MKAATKKHVRLRLVGVDSLVVPEFRRRPAWQRLLAWAWRPWRRHRVEWVPSPTILVNGKTIFCHPSHIERLKRERAEKIANR